MNRYKATAPARDKDGNPTFNGKTAGIQFTTNVAHFDDLSLSPSVKRDYREIEGSISTHIATILLQDFHYQVEVYDPATNDWKPFNPLAQAAPAAAPAAESTPESVDVNSDIKFDIAA